MPGSSDSRGGRQSREPPSPRTGGIRAARGNPRVRGQVDPHDSEIAAQLRTLARSVVVIGTSALMRDGIGTNGPISLRGMPWDAGAASGQPDLLDPWWAGVRSVNTLQQWQGTVESIGRKHFRARLEDLTAPGDDEFTRIPISDIDEKDLVRLEIGSVFNLIIGYSRGEDGTMRRETLIFLREDLGSNDTSGSELADILNRLAADE